MTEIIRHPSRQWAEEYHLRIRGRLPWHIFVCFAADGIEIASLQELAPVWVRYDCVQFRQKVDNAFKRLTKRRKYAPEKFCDITKKLVSKNDAKLEY